MTEQVLAKARVLALLPGSDHAAWAYVIVRRCRLGRLPSQGSAVSSSFLCLLLFACIQIVDHEGLVQRCLNLDICLSSAIPASSGWQFEGNEHGEGRLAQRTYMHKEAVQTVACAGPQVQVGVAAYRCKPRSHLSLIGFIRNASKHPRQEDRKKRSCKGQRCQQQQTHRQRIGQQEVWLPCWPTKQGREKNYTLTGDGQAHVPPTVK